MQSRALVLSAAILAAVLSSSPAFAGFEWHGDAPAAAAHTPEGNGSDIIRWDAPPQAAPVITPAAPVQPVEAVPATMTAVPEVTAETVTPPQDGAAMAAPAAVESEQILTGFGKELPLAVALQQILPAGTKYSFSRDVNPSQTVSWEGGKPWQSVLSDALKAASLEFRMQNNIVAIGPLRPAQEAESAAAPVTEQPAAEDVVIKTTEPQNRSAQIPQDMLITSAPAAQPAAPVSIRRERPKPSVRTEQEQSQAAPAAAMPIVENTVVETTVEQLAMQNPAGQNPAGQNHVVIAPAKPVMLEKPSMIVGEVWQAKGGDTLRDTLKKWTATAGVDLFWSTDFDYRVTQDSRYVGNFSEAVKGLLDQYVAVNPQPYGQLHQDGQNPKVLIIRAYDDNALRG